MSVGVKARCQRCNGTILRNACVACGWSQSWAQEAAETARLLAEGQMRVNNHEGQPKGPPAQKPMKYWAEQMRLWRGEELDQMVRAGVRKALQAGKDAE